MASSLAPAEIAKYYYRVELFRNILENGGHLFVDGRKKTVKENDERNEEVLSVLKKTKENNLSNLRTSLSRKQIFFENETSGTSLSNIDKDVRFIEVNLGHVFEAVFACGLIAGIKKRPSRAVYETSKKMQDVTENDIIEVIKDVASKKGELSYKVDGLFQDKEDTLILKYDSSSLAIQGMIKTWQKEWNNKKSRLIPPVLTYLNHVSDFKNLRANLYTNGTSDRYTVDLIGKEQEKPDVKIKIEIPGQKVELDKISLKLGSGTFGSVKGSEENTISRLFDQFKIKIAFDKEDRNLIRVHNAYEQAAKYFNNLDTAKQLEGIQYALTSFYAGGSVDNFRVLKFVVSKTRSSVYSRNFQDFTKNYIEKFGNKKIKLEFEKPSSKKSSVRMLKFKLPNNSYFLKIRYKVTDETSKTGSTHEIEEMGGMNSIIGGDISRK